MVAGLERKRMHELVAALLDDTEILHHVRLGHAGAAQGFAQSTLVAANLAEYALNALLQMRHSARRLLGLEIISEGAGQCQVTKADDDTAQRGACRAMQGALTVQPWLLLQPSDLLGL